MDDLERERRALALFDALADVGDDEREDWIARKAAGDPALEGRLRSLLEAERRANMRTGGAWIDDDDDEPLPDRIAAYRVTARIGQGGMGSVYRGERASGDFDHVVAIKVIKPGLLSEALSARFRRERQTLAQLSHPNIAQLFDGGEMADGSPYIVMEFVDGQSLLQWVEQQDPSMEQRLDLFVTVCGAVGFAHRSLIVHRDLTPSNILVTRDGTAKLIDFGIARAPEGDASAVTPSRPSIAQLSLTPGYAAPERLVSAEVSTAADIYSLGRLLGWLVPRGDPELKSIVGRATATDPNGRYPTAEALAEDVQAWRQGKPVSAFAGGRGYVATKFARRHRVALAGSAAALTALLAALALALIANHRAQLARGEAETRFNDVRSLAGYMLVDLNSQLARTPGNTAARAALADQAQRYLSALAESPGASEQLRLETANGLIRLAELQGVPSAPNLALHEQALANLDRADRLLATIRTAPTGAAQALSAVHRSLIELHANSDDKRAGELLAKADKVLEAVPSARRDTAWIDTQRALRRAELDRLDVADERGKIADVAAQVLVDRKAWPQAKRTGFDARADDAVLLYYRALMTAERDVDKALALHVEAEAAFDRLLAERKDDPGLLYRATWNAMDGFAAGSQAGSEDVSNRLIRKGAAMIDRLAMIDDRDDAVHALQAIAKEGLAQNLRDHDLFDEAVEVEQQVVALRRAAIGSPATSTQLANLGFSEMILGIIARDGKKRSLACSAWTDSLAHMKAAKAAGHLTGFHESLVPGLDSHVKACAAGGSIQAPMR